MFGRIIIGLMFVGAGLAIIYNSHNLVRIFGNVPWAENNLGGTRQLYILSGLFLMVFGFLFLFGVVEIGGSVV